MKIESPLHAEHQLDQLAGQFERWRQTRTHPNHWIPPELWEHSAALTALVPPSRVAKQLRLRLVDLKHQMATRQASPHRQDLGREVSPSGAAPGGHGTAPRSPRDPGRDLVPSRAPILFDQPCLVALNFLYSTVP